MLEIMGIKTGVVEEIDSDDEFDIETAANGTYYRRGGQGLGHAPGRGERQVPAQQDQLWWWWWWWHEWLRRSMAA